MNRHDYLERATEKQTRADKLKKKQAIQPRSKGYAPLRNRPCPCGSGERYKKCCLLKEREAERQARQQLREQLEQEVNDSGKEDIEFVETSKD